MLMQLPLQTHTLCHSWVCTPVTVYTRQLCLYNGLYTRQLGVAHDDALDARQAHELGDAQQAQRLERLRAVHAWATWSAEGLVLVAGWSQEIQKIRRIEVSFSS